MLHSFPDRIQQLPAFDGPFDAFHLAAQDCEIYFARYPAGTDISPHNHDTDNYGIITQGTLILTLQGKPDQQFSAGEWYHIPPGVIHAARFDTDTQEIEFWFKAPCASPSL